MLQLSTNQSGSRPRVSARIFLSFVALLFLQPLQAGMPSTPAAAKPVLKSATLSPEWDQKLQESAFWRKPKLWQAMQKDRKIWVSVQNSQAWSFKGAGIVAAPWVYTLEQAKNFDRLRVIDEHFTKVEWDPTQSVLSLNLKFLGRERSLNFELSELQRKEDALFFFRSQGPWLMGLEGVLWIKDNQRQSTEAAVLATHKGQLDWIPDFIFSIAAEGVMHHVAERLRKSLEKDYKKE